MCTRTRARIRQAPPGAGHADLVREVASTDQTANQSYRGSCWAACRARHSQLFDQVRRRFTQSFAESGCCLARSNEADRAPHMASVACRRLVVQNLVVANLQVVASAWSEWRRTMLSGGARQVVETHFSRRSRSNIWDVDRSTTPSPTSGSISGRGSGRSDIERTLAGTSRPGRHFSVPGNQRRRSA
jgi:hypothetical protein